MKKRKKNSSANHAAMTFLVLGISAIIFPLYIAIVVSLKAPSDMTIDVAGLLSLPAKFNFSNYIEAIRVTDFWRSLANSLFITIATVVLSIVIHSLAGYVIGRGMTKRKAFKLSYYYIISGMFVPFALLMLPLIKQMAGLGLANQGGVILGYIVFFMPINVLLYTGYLKNVPVSLEEAGYIDGTNAWETFWKIIFPVMSPMHATVAILTALSTWNDVMLPLVLMGGSGINTLPLAQLTFQTQFGTNYNLAFASYILALIPIVVFYLICQRQIITGVMSGSIK